MNYSPFYFSLLLFISTLISSCTNSEGTNSTEKKESSLITPASDSTIVNRNPEGSESMVYQIDTSKLYINDSLGFAYRSIDDHNNHLLSLKFYKRNNNGWEYHYSIDSIDSQWGNDSLELMDFNFDGIYDARLSTGTGARGANEFFDVFIMDSKTRQFKKLIVIDNPPNLIPNKKTKKVEATRFYGKTMFEEHLIQNDTLKQLSSVEVWYDGKWTFRKYERYINGEPDFVKLDSIQDEGSSAFSK